MAHNRKNKHRAHRLFRERGAYCERCGCALCHQDKGSRAKGNGARPVVLHHIIPKSEGGTNRLSNLLLSCPECEAVHHSPYDPEDFRSMKKLQKQRRRQSRIEEKSWLQFADGDGWV